MSHLNTAYEMGASRAEHDFTHKKVANMLAKRLALGAGIGAAGGAVAGGEGNRMGGALLGAGLGAGASAGAGSMMQKNIRGQLAQQAGTGRALAKGLGAPELTQTMRQPLANASKYTKNTMFPTMGGAERAMKGPGVAAVGGM